MSVRTVRQSPVRERQLVCVDRFQPLSNEPSRFRRLARLIELQSVWVMAYNSLSRGVFAEPKDPLCNYLESLALRRLDLGPPIPLIPCAH